MGKKSGVVQRLAGWSSVLGIGMFAAASAFGAAAPKGLALEGSEPDAIATALAKRTEAGESRHGAGSRSRGRGNAAPNAATSQPCQQTALESLESTDARDPRNRGQRSTKALGGRGSPRGKPGATPAAAGGTPAVDCASAGGAGSGSGNAGSAANGNPADGNGLNAGSNPTGNQQGSAEAGSATGGNTPPANGGPPPAGESQWADMPVVPPPFSGSGIPPSILAPNLMLGGMGLPQDGPPGPPQGLTIPSNIPTDERVPNVPEPGTLGLIALGLAGLAAVRRRKPN